MVKKTQPHLVRKLESTFEAELLAAFGPLPGKATKAKRGRPRKHPCGLLVYDGTGDIVRSSQDTAPLIWEKLRAKGVTKLPSRQQLEDWGLTPKPKRLSFEKTRNGTWECWRRAFIESEELIVMAAIRIAETGEFIRFPLKMDWDATTQGFRFKVDGYWVTTLIVRWKQLKDHLRRTGLFKSVKPESGLVFARLVVAVAGEHCEYNETLGIKRLEVAHWDHCSLNDRHDNLRVVTKAEHLRHDKGKGTRHTA